MEPPNSIPDIILISLSLIAVAVLSSSESALIAVNKYRIKHLMEKGDSRAKAVQRILDAHDKLFSAVILSGNLFTVLATSFGTALAIDFLGEDNGILTATVVMTFLTVVFGELTPKTFAVTHSEKVSLFLAKPLEIYIRAISPLIWIFHKSTNLILRLFGVKGTPPSLYVTEDEIKAMIKLGEEVGEIEEEEKEMLHRVFEFGDKMASEIMVPRTEIVAVSEDSSVDEALKIVSEKGYSRYPVIKENIDTVTGVLHTKDILIKMAKKEVNGETVKGFVRDAYYIPESKMATELLDEMQKRNFQIAIVVDEYGGTAGLITLEDIIEEIVGGLADEFEAMEAEREVEVIDERTFIVSGQTGMNEVNELIGAELTSAEYNTIGGFVFGLFGRLPKVGEQVRYHSLRFLILEMEDRKIVKLKITKL